MEALMAFNRKERDHLVKMAYCGNSLPELSDVFRGSLERVLSPRVEKIPEDDGVFFGMDYHLNWLFCAIWAAHKSPSQSGAYENPRGHWRIPKRVKTNGSTIVKYASVRLIEQNQEDLDFIVAFNDPSKNRLNVILVEAKLDTSWDSVQFSRKVGRIDNISRACKQAGFDPCIDWSIVLLSPKKPTDNQLKHGAQGDERTGLDFCNFPKWVFMNGEPAAENIPHIKFNSRISDESSGRKRVNRLGSSSPGIGFWKITK